MKPELKYGLIAGGAMSAWMLVEFQLGLHTTRIAFGHYTAWVTDLIPVVMLYFLLKHRFALLQKDWVPAWQGMLYGLLASVTFALVFYIFLNLYQYFVNPAWVDYQLEWKVARLRAAGAAETEIRQQIVALRQAYGPVGLALYVPAYTVLGGCVSVLVTLWLNWGRKHRAYPA